jgi:hypothetical protein
MSEQNNEAIELQREMVRWLRLLGLEKAKTALSSTLDTEKKVLAYHLSDGKNTSTVIANLVGISQSRITDWWKEWLAVGLGESISASGGGRFRKSFDLKMFGIIVPEIKKLEETKPATESEADNK